MPLTGLMVAAAVCHATHTGSPYIFDAEDDPVAAAYWEARAQWAIVSIAGLLFLLVWHCQWAHSAGPAVALLAANNKLNLLMAVHQLSIDSRHGRLLVCCCQNALNLPVSCFPKQEFYQNQIQMAEDLENLPEGPCR